MCSEMNICGLDTMCRGPSTHRPVGPTSSLSVCLCTRAHLVTASTASTAFPASLALPPPTDSDLWPSTVSRADTSRPSPLRRQEYMSTVGEARTSLTYSIRCVHAKCLQKGIRRQCKQCGGSIISDHMRHSRQRSGSKPMRRVGYQRAQARNN